MLRPRPAPVSPRCGCLAAPEEEEELWSPTTSCGVAELSALHSRDITYAVLIQGRNTAYGPADAQTSYDESWGGRPVGQWPRLAAGHSDDLGTV